MLLDGASGLLVVLGISVILNIVIFMYFRNKTTSIENKMDVMFTIIQEHATQRSAQENQPNVRSDGMMSENNETTMENSNEMPSQQTMENEKIPVSDVDSEDSSLDGDDSDSDSVSDNEQQEDGIDLNKTILLQPKSNVEELTADTNEILSNGELMEANQLLQTVQANIEQQNDDLSDDDLTDDSSDSDNDEGNGEKQSIVINNEPTDDSKLLNIENLVEEIPDDSSSVSQLPPNLKKLTVPMLRDLVLERWPNMDEAVSKMKKKELLGILKD